MATDLTRKTIIVPWDFTPQCEVALLHAYQLAQVVGDNILLLYIRKLSKWASNSVKEKTEEELKEIRLRLKKESAERESVLEKERQELIKTIQGRGFKDVELYTVELQAMAISASNLTETIGELYVSLDANMIVSAPTYKMHNGRTLDMFDVLRKARSTNRESLPFMLVEDPPKHKYYTEVVVPMDYDRKYKQTLPWITFLAHYYSCNIDLIKRPLKSESKKRAMLENVYFTKKVLNAKNVVYGIKTARVGQDFYSEVHDFIKSIDADLVVLMTNNLKAFFGRTKVKFGVPVLYINPLSEKFQGFY